MIETTEEALAGLLPGPLADIVTNYLPECAAIRMADMIAIRTRSWTSGIMTMSISLRRPEDPSFSGEKLTFGVKTYRTGATYYDEKRIVSPRCIVDMIVGGRLHMYFRGPKWNIDVIGQMILAEITGPTPRPNLSQIKAKVQI